MTSESVREWMTDRERNRERVVIDERRLFSLSSGADVRNSWYVWYEDIMGDRYSVKMHGGMCACSGEGTDKKYLSKWLSEISLKQLLQTKTKRFNKSKRSPTCKC